MAAKYTASFFCDMKSLKVMPAMSTPSYRGDSQDYRGDQGLMEKGYAYRTQTALSFSGDPG
jgi:cysteinyl-tRNA synthetase